jgi:tetratricopeptide (TPR) repeat protein
MNSFSRKRSGEDLCSDIPEQRKIARFDDVSQSKMIRLNQCGILNMMNGKDDEAEQNLHEELSSLRSIELRISPEFLERNDDKHNVMIANILQQRGKPTLDYDDGMFNYFELISLDTDHNDSIIKASLLFNIGLIHLKKKKYTCAHSWFELSKSELGNAANMTDIKIVEMYVKISHAKGQCQYTQGFFDKSEMCYQESLQLKDLARLSDDYEASAKNAIAVNLFHSSTISNLSHVITLFQESLSIFTRMKMKKEVGTVLNNIGRVFYLSGNYEKANEAYSLSLAVRRKLYKPTSVDLAVTICNLAQTLHQVGKLDEAITLFNEFLNLAETHTNLANHHDIIIVLSHVACIHHESGNLQDSRVYYEAALTAARLTSNNDGSVTASLLNKLGSVCYKTKDTEAALSYLQEGLKIEKVVYGDNHPNIIITLLNIAQIHREKGHYATAFLTYSRVHQIQTKGKVSNTLEISNTLFSMGMMLYRMKAFPSSFKCYQDALLLQRETYGENDNIEIAATLNSIGIVLFHMGKKEMAKSYFENSLSIRRRFLGPNHEDVTINVYNLAALHFELGEEYEAAGMFKECLRIEQETQGENCHDSIQTLQHLALVHQQMGELKESLIYLDQALRKERSRSGQSHNHVAKLLNLMGNIYLQLADTKKMMQCYSEATRIYEKQNENLVITGYTFYGVSKLHPECAEAA